MDDAAAQGQKTEPVPDYFGMASLASGILAGAGCFGTCIPYLGSLFMFASMGFSLLGTLLGVVAVTNRRRDSESEALAWGGLITSGTFLALWLLYWIFALFVMFAVLGGMFVFILAENL
ncbi:MAG: hypothetical protein R3F61_03850 [Myxococcota bacterium]